MLTPFRLARLVALVAWLLVLLTVQVVALALGLGLARRLPVLLDRGVARILGLSVIVRGEVAETPPVLFISNHSSWLDIVVLSSLASVSFVTKIEIGAWPGIGFLAKLQRSVFIGRERSRIQGGLQALRARLGAGDNLVLFAEGTRGDGNRIGPFKSGLFAAAEGAGGAQPRVQPVSIAYTHVDGLPLGRRGRSKLAWYGDMSLLKHFWAMLGQGSATIVVDFHPPVRAGDFGSRKVLAAHCRQLIVASHARALAGNWALAATGAGVDPSPAVPGHP